MNAAHSQKEEMMKKKFAIVACLIIGAFCLAGCGTDMSDSKYLGTWTAISAESSGMEMSVESIIGGEMVFVLKDNGTCTLTIAGDETSGTWEETENGFKVEDEFDFIVDDDVALVEYEGVDLYFVKK